jgi:hypothetical protein
MLNILLIFKDRKKITKNDKFWTDKLSIKFNIFTFYIEDFLRLTNLKIINEINRIIENKNINFVIIEGDHNSIVDKIFINLISKKIPKGIFLGDDDEWHDVNKINATSCDFVFNHCFVSVLKYRQYGIKTLFVPIEANGKIWRNYNLSKDIDLLFFGRQKILRDKYFKELENNGINVLKTTPYDEISNTDEKLAKLINRSKIVLNFSKSASSKRFWNRNRILKFNYQIKGRIYMSGLCNTLVVSEIDPSASLFYDKGELPQFNNIKDAVFIIKKFLNSETQLQEATKKFHLKTLELEDSRYIKKIEDFLLRIKIDNKSEIPSLDIWYMFIHIKQYFRLRFINNNLKAFFAQFLENFILSKNLDYKNFFLFNVISLIFFLRYLVFVPIQFFKKLKDKVK